jgi:2-keto-4-pentenoate hydratase
MDVKAAAAELLDMRRTQRVEPDLPSDLRPTDLAAAYAIQAALVDGLGGDPIGYKCACTSRIAQDALRIDRPLFGRLLPETTSLSGASLDASSFLHRVVEAEFAFRLGSDVEPIGGGHTRDSIAEHIDAVIPAIEIVDYRYESWTLGALQVAADNAIHGWWVHGEPVTDWRGGDLGSAAVSVTRNGELVTVGSGANVLGHPLTVMEWLADELPKFGMVLRAGDYVTTGVTTDVFEAEVGDALRAEFAGTGGVELGFE